MLRIGALNYDANDTSEPEPTIEILKEAQESEALGLYHKALALQKAGDVTEAENLYSDVLKTSLLTEVPCPSSLETEDILKNPGLVLKYTVYKNLADIAANQEDNDKALDNYLEAALIDDSDVSLWWKIGDIALKVTNLKLARYSFEKGLLANSNHWPCLDNLVTVLFVIGDYAACLETIIKGLEKDSMFIKGLIIRDQIFKEEPHFRKDYQEFNCLFVNESKEDSFKEEYSKYIEEALVMREKRRLLARKEDLPKIKLSKQISYYTWACLGDCLVHLYDELTNSENPKSLCRPIDLEKYSRSSEQQSLLAIPSPETNWKGTKLTSKDDDKKSLKRKKMSSNLFEKEMEPVAKRRSARVKSSKSKEEDVHWTATLQSFLPEFLRSDSTAENEDSQDSIPDDTDFNLKMSTAEICKQNQEEARLVSDFVNENIRNSGCIDILSNFIEAVANQSDSQRKWYHGLPQIYVQIYRRVRKHVQFPCLPPEESGKMFVSKFVKTVLVALELQLDEWLAMKSKVPLNFSPAQSSAKAGKKVDSMKDNAKPKESNVFLSDLHYLLFLTSCEDIFKDFWVEFITRLYWLEARFFLLIGDIKQSLRAFEKCIGVLTPNNGIITNPNLCFRLENCVVDSCITLNNVQKKVESVQRCLSLEEVNKLYESGMYAEVVDLLSPLLKQRVTPSKVGEKTAAPPERPTQLLLLQDSLSKLGQVNKCIVCSEFAINEALHQMTPTEDWKIIINGFLNCLNSVLAKDIAVQDIELKDVIFRLVQSMIKIIEISMESFDSGDIVLATSIPWLILYKIIEIYNQLETRKVNSEESSIVSYLSPRSFQFICSAHDLLGRRGLCCDDDGALLCAFLKVLRECFLYQPSNSYVKKEDVQRELEQCFYCLYGHPSKKTKSRKLHDHVTSQIPLTWEYSQIIYEYFKPYGLPTLDNKTNTISMEGQLLMRRVVAVVPQKDVEVVSFDTLQGYIDGLLDLPVFDQTDITNKRSRVQDLFYYLADFYFKNKEFGKAIKFYMHDVCLNPTRFESWAAMALARGARLEEKISACEPKSDGPIRKHSVSTLRCFEKAVEMNNSNCMILEEYGSTAYMLNSQASRRLREHIQDEEYTTETVTTLTERRNEMIKLSEKCFTQARQCVKKAEGEPWLHSYMLGKATEKLNKSPDIYLDFYQLATQQLHAANANYPKRIPYHNPPEYSIESLEMYYRVHASILNLLRRTAGEINYALIEQHLDKADQMAFVKSITLKSTEKTSVRDESTLAKSQSVALTPTKHEENISIAATSDSVTSSILVGVDSLHDATTMDFSSNQSTTTTTTTKLESCNGDAKNATDFSQELFESPGKVADGYENTQEESQDNSMVDIFAPVSSQLSRTSCDDMSMVTSQCQHVDLGLDARSYVENANDGRAEGDDNASRPEGDDNASRARGDDNASRAEGGDNASRTERYDNASRAEGDVNATRAEGDDNASRAEGSDNASRTERYDNASRAEGDVNAKSVKGDDNASRARGDDNASRAEGGDNASRTERYDNASRAEGDVNATRAEGDDNASRTEGDVNATRAEGDANASRAEGDHIVSRAEGDDNVNRAEGGDNVNRTGVDNQMNVVTVCNDSSIEAQPGVQQDYYVSMEQGVFVSQACGTEIAQSDDVEMKSKEQQVNSDETPAVANLDDRNSDSKKSSVSGMTQVNIDRKFSSSEEEGRFKNIIDRCMQALTLCLKRFPEHYKSQYKMAYVTTYFPTHKNLALSRELLLGVNSPDVRTMQQPAHGLFTERSKTNLFQYLWRIPIDEIDRRGSFCTHVCKAVELLLFVLSELKEWDTLLTISGLLHLTPSKDKKYLRDNDRAFLALKAFDMAKDILRSRIHKAESMSRTDRKLLLLDCYEAYKLAQKMQTSIQITEHYLIKLFKLLLHQGDPASPLPDKIVLEQSLKFCLANVENSRKLSAMTQTLTLSASSPSQNSQQSLATEGRRDQQQSVDENNKTSS